MTITLQVVGDDKVIAKLQSFPDRLKNELKSSMDKITIDLASYVKDSKLSGQVLKVKTGTLRRSIRASTSVGAESVTGYVRSRAGGEPVVYAAYHEYGFHGTESVKEYLRRTAKGKMTPVCAHSRTINYGGRPFMRPSLAENKQNIQSSIQSAVDRTFQ